jgi:acyl dehydratase
MPLDYARLMALELPEREHSYTERDSMLYALGIGFGSDPMDEAELPFVFEKHLKVAPTMATVIAWNDGWAARAGLNVVMIVHGEQRITLHRPLPPAATVRAVTRIVDIFDKGADKGAVLLVESRIRDAGSGEPLCTNLSTVFARGDGGFGGPQGSGPAPHPLPERAPDAIVDAKTQASQALIYRLSGDRNPLHADPDFARAAGFPRPILHGLCSYGYACRAVLRAFCDYDPALIRGFDVRFSAPVFPGETIRTEMWRDGNVVSFRARVLERDAIVLNNGKATLAD